MIGVPRARHAIIRADASRQIGGGHLARCLTLADALRTVGMSAHFATASGECSTWIAARGFPSSLLTCAPGGGEDLRQTIEIARAERAALAIVDGYQFSTDFSKALHVQGLFTCCIDDLASQPFACDVVLNTNVHASSLAYEVAPECRLLLGPGYALVRDEFVAARGAREPVPAEVRRVLVTMGAADPDRWTERVLRSLGHMPVGVEVQVVVGAVNVHGAAVRACAGTLAPRHAVEVLEDVSDMAEPMLWCDMAITAGGTTCLELACIGVPAIAVAIAPNQSPGVAELTRQGLMIGMASGPSEEDMAAAIRCVLGDAALRRSMVSRQRELVDGQGKHRAVQRILEWLDGRQVSS